MNQRIEEPHINLDALLQKHPEQEPEIVLISDLTIHRAIKAQESGKHPLAKELSKELQTFAQRYRREFVEEATERMRQENLAADEAMDAVMANVADHLRNSLSSGVPALEAKQEHTLRRDLADTDALLRHQRGNKGGIVVDPYGYEMLLEKKIHLEKQLYPDRPENIVETALVDRANVDADTHVNATLFPYLAKKERQRFDREKAEHQEVMSQRRAAKEAADAHHLDLNEEEPPTLSGVTPLKKRTLWQRLTGRG